MSEGDNPQDPRPEFFGNFIIKALKIKAEKWFRLMVTEEQGNKVYNFLDNPDCIVLIIFQVPIEYRTSIIRRVVYKYL